MNMPDILEAIRAPYGLSDTATISPLGNGHINRTALVSDGKRRMVAQQVNTAVFTRPRDLLYNARMIEEHLFGKEGALRVVRHVPDSQGRFLHGPQEDVRVLEYIPATTTVEVLKEPGQAYTAAQGFARFSRQLSDFDASKLVAVLPDFHSPDFRWRQFLDALERDAAGRAGECAGEVAFAMGVEPLMRDWQELMNKLPVRVCHNDCKINNLLFHKESGAVAAIIDLDTCMPGPVLTDFGDLVRTCCSPEAEDSTRLENVVARPEVFRALTEGYMDGWRGEITRAEIDSLVQGGMMMCFIIGLRFLTDFLDGDRYFAIAHPGHNLERARNQLRLFDSLRTRVADHAVPA